MKTSSIIKNSILGKIDSPEDVKNLDIDELKLLSGELREFILETVSRTGGHLASSLGVIELTLAMLKVFSPPKDRIVFDVGHQAYAYKILTGRRDRFHTLRTKGGLAGFPKRVESNYDFFDVGHAGNAISVAAGLAQARCFSGSDHKVIAVVGDGSLTCGVSFEGLNQAGALNKDLIIILNDNEMSISPNVGAMAAYLNRVMTGQTVMRFRSELKNILKSMGKSIYGMAKQFEDALKGLITPGRLFEDLGFNYVGPIDGHRLKHLIDTFNNVKRFHEPVLIHTITCKGKGYCQAEENPSKFHGIGPFCIDSGNVVECAGPPSYTSVFGETLIKLAEKNSKIVAVTAAMEYGTGLHDFAGKFPKRFFDVGIAEQHGVVFAAGLAKEGYRPVVAIYSTFIQRGYDHMIHDVCMQGFPVLFAMDRAGLVGEDGPTHHGVFDIAFCRTIPNLVMMAPSDEAELGDMLATAFSIDVPCSIRYPRAAGTGMNLNRDPLPIPVGKGRMLREGKDLLIIALGSMLEPSMKAAHELADLGWSVGVMDPRFVKPLDKDLIIDQVNRTKNVLTVEEGVLAGGFGSAVLELLADEMIQDVRVARLGIPDAFIEHGTRHELLVEVGLTPEAIRDRALQILSPKGETKVTRFSVLRN